MAMFDGGQGGMRAPLKGQEDLTLEWPCPVPGSFSVPLPRLLRREWAGLGGHEGGGGGLCHSSRCKPVTAWTWVLGRSRCE